MFLKIVFEILLALVHYFQANSDRTPVQEMKAAEERGVFAYRPPRTDGDDEEFVEARESPSRTQVITGELLSVPVI